MAEVVDGRDVLDAVARWRPDVVLLDIQLPGIDGVEVARRLHARGGARPVVILMSTRDAAYGRRVAAGIAAGIYPRSSSRWRQSSAPCPTRWAQRATKSRPARRKPSM